MGLREEIANTRKEIVVDSYPMSIGEMANLYRDKELEVHPEFQRYFRWDSEQKTRLIESILLGVPIPPIFVSQRADGKWDVIDGQQRLSTILQFLQILKKPDDTDYEPLVLLKTKFLPSLENVSWNNEELFPLDLRITFKREKLNFTIIKESYSSEMPKYEMFQRLNTGGTHLSPQELRNCLLIMINKQLYQLINELNEIEEFQSCLPLSESQKAERYDMELVIRFLLYVTFDEQFLKKINKGRNMDLFLTEEIEKFAQNNTNQWSFLKTKFHKIFDLLNEVLGEDSFKRYRTDGVRQGFKGPFMVSAFESIVPGLFENLEYFDGHRDELKEKIKQIYEREEYISAMKAGTRALDRMIQLILFSRSWLGKNEN